MTTDTEVEFHLSTADVARRLGCSSRTVTNRAKPLGLGIEIGGKAGYRYSDRDVEQLVQALRPTAPEPAPRRKRRRRGVAA